MTIVEKIKMFEGKKAFVTGISKAFEAHKTGIEFIEYEVYQKVVDDCTYFKEYVVVTFNGGGKSVRNVGGNSHTANFREIGKLIDGGYYDEVRD